MVEPGKFFENNTCGALNLIENAVASTGRPDSSSHRPRRCTRGRTRPIKETDPIAPVNAYGATKLMVEQMLAWYRQINGLRYGVLRYFNACGATAELGEDHQPESHLIPLVLQVALGKREKIKIYGDGLPDAVTAPASATTSTCATWRRRTCSRSTRSANARSR